jgi:hypothetical protein
MDTEGPFRRRDVALTTHPCLVTRSRMSMSYITSPPLRLHGVAGQLFLTLLLTRYCYYIRAYVQVHESYSSGKCGQQVRAGLPRFDLSYMEEIYFFLRRLGRPCAFAVTYRKSIGGFIRRVEATWAWSWPLHPPITVVKNVCSNTSTFVAHCLAKHFRICLLFLIF